MPGYDSTGPEGQGPKTGRGAGRCGGNSPDSVPPVGTARRGRGRGAGRRRGAWQGRGRRR
ncbi:MAG: DUF5320 domain-containing protein [Synergistales bacterium]|nr:DUF5320 domain-containing protein [Synergistales bacterium]